MVGRLVGKSVILFVHRLVGRSVGRSFICSINQQEREKERKSRLDFRPDFYEINEEKMRLGNAIYETYNKYTDNNS